MRDLEIRGAGNLLGDEQSGHVAAIGFELYLEMLNEAVLRGQGEEPPEREVRVDIAVSAYIPTDYVPLETAEDRPSPPHRPGGVAGGRHHAP